MVIEEKTPVELQREPRVNLPEFL